MLSNHWQEAVGPLVADHTKPLKLTGGKLILAVESSSWMNELQYFVPEIIEKMNASFGKEMVKEIRMKVATSLQAKPIEKEDDIPEIDDDDRAKAQAVGSHIKDEKVRERVEAAFLKSRQIRKTNAKRSLDELERYAKDLDES